MFREFVGSKFVEGARVPEGRQRLDPDSKKMGPLANPRRVTGHRRHGAGCRGEGRAKLETGGHRIGNKGYFYEPTVVIGVPKDARAMNEEPFGPLAPDLPASRTFDEVAEEANRLPCRPGLLRLHQFDQARRPRSAPPGRSRQWSRSTADWPALCPKCRSAASRTAGYGEGGTEAMDGYFNTKFITQDRGCEPDRGGAERRLALLT